MQKRVSAAYWYKLVTLSEATRAALRLALSGCAGRDQVVVELGCAVSDFVNDSQVFVPDAVVSAELKRVQNAAAQFQGATRALAPKAKGLTAAVAATKLGAVGLLRALDWHLTMFRRALGLAGNQIPSSNGRCRDRRKGGRPTNIRHATFAFEVAMILGNHGVKVSSHPGGVFAAVLSALLPSAGLAPPGDSSGNPTEASERLLKKTVKRLADGEKGDKTTHKIP